MLQWLKHEVSNYFTNMGQIHIYNQSTNQPINQSTISVLSSHAFFPEFGTGQESFLQQNEQEQQ